jgi:hypothetical protein
MIGGECDVQQPLAPEGLNDAIEKPTAAVAVERTLVDQCGPITRSTECPLCARSGRSCHLFWKSQTSHSV